MAKPSVSNLSDCVGALIHALLLRTYSNLICVYVCTCNRAVTLGIYSKTQTSFMT